MWKQLTLRSIELIIYQIIIVEVLLKKLLTHNVFYKYTRIVVFSLSSIFLINSTHAETQKLIIESGDSSLSQQAEKEWDKKDAAIDNRYACQTSDNHQLYWEPNTRRCLDRSTGRAVKP